MGLYISHGLIILSEEVCPELAPGPHEDQGHDVCFHFGEVPELDDLSCNGSASHFLNKSFVFQVEGIARYLIRDGHEIVIQSAPGSHIEDVRIYLLGSALGALLHQRGRFVLHGSAIETQRGAVVFVGPSGIGKSTLAAAFHARGYRILTDDVCSLDVDDPTGSRVFPGKAEFKLWGDTATALGFDIHAMRRVSPHWPKYAGALNSPYRPEPVPLHAIYLLSVGDDDSYTICSLSGVEQFRVLLDNTYRALFLRELAVEEQHFKHAAVIAQHTTIGRIVRPVVPLHIGALAQFVEASLALTPGTA